MATNSPAEQVVLMSVAVVAVSTAGPLIASAAAPLLAIAFWRNAMASGVLLPVALSRSRLELASLERRTWLLALLSGGFLALHFGAWISGLAFTTVASVVALTSTQPVWSAVIARVRGQHLPVRAWVGIGMAVAGAVALTGGDVALSPEAITGDLLGLAGGLFGAAYVAIGAEIRPTVTTTTYTAICYGSASVLLLVVCVLAGLPLAGYDATTWLLLVAVAIGPQMLGHSLFNRALQHTSATVVSLVMLLEVPGAALIAAAWLGQTPPLAAVPGGVLLLAGVAVVITALRPRTPPVPE